MTAEQRESRGASGRNWQIGAWWSSAEHPTKQPTQGDVAKALGVEEGEVEPVDPEIGVWLAPIPNEVEQGVEEFGMVEWTTNGIDFLCELP